MKFSTAILCLQWLFSSLAYAASDETDRSIESRCRCPTVEQQYTERRALEDVFCNKPSSGLTRRAGEDDGNGSGVDVGVSLPSVGLSLGNISTKLGNINLTVTNVTIALGNVDVENVSVGNISVIVSVPLPGASPVQAFSAFTSATSITSSTATATSTISSASATQSAGFFQHLVRQESDTTTAGVSIPTVSLPSATATVSGNPISLDTGSVITEIGNITVEVGHINVSVGDINISNITVGNIFVLVQIGQPDLTGALGNLTNTLNGITNR